MRLNYPTTSAIYFSRIYTSTSTSSDYSIRASNATTARGSVHSLLKSDKKDDLGLISALKDYLPHVIALENAELNDKIVSISDESIIWTVQSQLSPKGRSTSSTSITFELIHILHVYGIALFNLSQTIADNVGNYDSDITLSENQRRTFDDNLANAVNLLNTSAGIFKYISEIAIDNFESARDVDSQILNREYNTGLSKLSLAISQSLAIRKLMSPLFAYTLQNPGPPLPKNHPSPQILLKLHIDTSSLFSVSRMLLKSSIKSTFKVQHVDLPTDLKLFTKRCENFHSSIAKKWLGVDAASNGQTGFAIAWLRLSYDELSESSSSTSSERFKLLSKNTRKARDERKSLLEVELSSIDTYLKAYKQLNDTVHFQCIPSTSSLLSQIPNGRSLVNPIPFTLPKPAWTLIDSPDIEEESDLENKGSYALQGRYF